MALKISLKSNEQLIISGAVVKNVSEKTIALTIENEVPILREKDILSESKADTPCKYIYFVIQLMYIDEKNTERYHTEYWKAVKEVIKAAPSTTEMFRVVSEHIYNRKYYKALKEAKKIITYEEKAIKNALKTNTSV
jgi:flagellar protein FlbT